MVKGEGETMTTPIDLNILIKFINKFDGNRDKLSAFINNCKNAITLASSAQTDILFKYILSQLEGRAEAACSIKEFENWAQLEEFLKEHFGEKKHYSHLLSELQNSKQQINESVNQYGLRVETCLSKLLTEINVSIPTNKKQELAGRVAAMEDLALHTFVMGLQSKLATILRCRNPKSLNEAINFAVAEEKLLQTNKHTQNFDRSRPSTSREHVYRPSVNTQQLALTNSPHSNNALVCKYCKAEGHSIEKCRKREYNNSRRQNFSPSNQRPFFTRSEQTSRQAFNQRNVNHIQENTPNDDPVVVEPDENNDSGNLN